MESDFLDVYDEHFLRVHGFFAYRVDSRADVEDLTQLTFERALRAWPRFDPDRSRPGTWLLAIASNLLIDHYRRERSSAGRSVPDGDLDGARSRQPGPEEGLGLSAELAAALDGLTGNEREVLALRFGGDLSGPEIAGLLGLSLANVQQIASRGLRKLRAALDPPQAANGPTPSKPAAATASNRAPAPT